MFDTVEWHHKPHMFKTAAVPWIICSPTWFDVPPKHQIYIANSMQQLVPRPPRSTKCSLHMQRTSRNITQCWHCVKIRLHASDTNIVIKATTLFRSTPTSWLRQNTAPCLGYKVYELQHLSPQIQFIRVFLKALRLSRHMVLASSFCPAWTTSLASFSWHDFWTCNLLQ